jgi:integrase
MARTTKRNNITSPELLDQVLLWNQQLQEDFLVYLKSVDRSDGTISQYKNDLDIFFVWNMQRNGNKKFIEVTKREFARFQNHALTEWAWSPKRIRRVKSVISSMSNYIENILDEEPEFMGYRSTINKIESPANATVREKSIFTETELKQLLDHLIRHKQYDKAAALALAMYSGRRKSELPRFKVSHFREENVIFGAFWKTDEQIRTKGRGSKGKLMHLYVLKDKFEPYLNLWLADRERRGIDSEWLLVSVHHPDRQITIDTLDHWADEFTKFLGKDFYWHAMRHFFTTMLARDDVPVNVIQDIVQWESADMVKLYTDITADENIGKYFGKGEINDKEKEEPGKAFAEEAGKEVGIKDGVFNSSAGIVGRVQINRESWPTVGGWIQERGAEWQKQTAERYMTYIRMISVNE